MHKIYILCITLGALVFGHKCETKYITLAHTNETVVSALDGLSKKELKKTQKKYETFIQKKYIDVDTSSQGQIFGNYGIRLAQRYHAGDHHAQELLKMGFYFSSDFPDKRERLLPPKDFEVLITHLAKQAEDLVKSGKVTKDELIEFALIFHKPVDIFGIFHLQKNIIPQKKPWPKDKFTLHTVAEQTDHEIFYHFIREGVFQFGIDAFLTHDIGHWTELVAYPEMMKGWRRYADSLKTEPAHGESNMYGWPKIKPTVKAAKSFILAEWFSLPDISKADEIKKLIPHFYKKNIKTYDSDLAHLTNLKLEERRQHYDEIIKKAEPLLLRFGGALRDHYNLARFTTDQELLGMLVDPPADFNARLSQETLHAQVRLLKLANEIRFNPTPPKQNPFALLNIFNDQNIAHIYNIPQEERNRDLDTAMLQLAARIETALYKAVELNLDIETVHKESRLQKPTKDSKTYQYLKSFVPKHWANAYAFELEE
jgi:hypothetical protein